MNITDITSKVVSPNGTMLYLINDEQIGRSYLEYGEWDENEISFVLAMIKQGDVIIDVGANIGSHTVAFAKSVGNTGKVECFEPQPVIAEILLNNIQANKLKNVTMHQKAVGKSEGVAFIPKLDYSKYADYSAISLVNAKEVDKEINTVTISVIPIDSLNLKKLDFVKISAVHMGHFVVEGMKATIERCRPIIFSECNTIEEAALVKYAMQQHSFYDIYVVKTRAFNPENYKHNTLNFFKNAWDTSLLFYPKYLSPLADIQNDKINVTKINDSEEIYSEILKTSRYEDDDIHARDWNWLQQKVDELSVELNLLQNQHTCFEKLKALNFRSKSLTIQNSELRSIIMQLKNTFNNNTFNNNFVKIDKKFKKKLSTFIEKNTRSLRRFTEKNTRSLRRAFNKK